ncbi:MAG: efflux RND transporter periplasmic adaptor subunit [Verrucomicrobiales bacterium]|nr:efflux RND transporter periplasmic adaptor subunit [Verrucomicrobiales bacterium]
MPSFAPQWLVVFVLGATLLSGCKKSPEAKSATATATAQEVMEFQLAMVTNRFLDRAIDVTGSLLPIDQTPVSVKVPGRLESLVVDLGSFVREGDLIARVEAPDYDLRVRQAEAALGEARARVGLPLEGENDQVEVEALSSVKEARAVLEEALANRKRIDTLTVQGILSTAELDTASATYKVALSRYEEALEGARTRVAQLLQRRAEFDIARKQLADTYLLAPFDGAVQSRRANIGEYLTPGSPVVVLVRVDPLRLRVEVSERDAMRIKAGQPVRVNVEGDPKTYDGEVKRLSPAIAQGSRTLVVEADVPSHGQLRPGAFARARIVTVSELAAVTIPADGVVTFAGIEKVFAVTNGLAQERRITTGDRGDGWVEVVAGLRAGEWVVRSPGNLQTGRPVRSAAESGGTRVASGNKS